MKNYKLFNNNNVILLFKIKDNYNFLMIHSQYCNGIVYHLNLVKIKNFLMLKQNIYKKIIDLIYLNKVLVIIYIYIYNSIVKIIVNRIFFILIGYNMFIKSR